MSDLLSYNTIIVNEKVRVLFNEYALLDPDGRQIGCIKEGHSIWRFLISRAYSPTSLMLFDADGNLVARMKKGWSFLHPTFLLYDHQGVFLCTIRKKFTLIRPKYQFFDPEGNEKASLEGNWIAWEFSIVDDKGNIIASINKKWKGLMHEMFTTADKYQVAIEPSVTDSKMRTALLMASCTIDLICREDNN